MNGLLTHGFERFASTIGTYPPPPLTDRVLFESPILVPVAVLILAVIIGFGLGRAAKGKAGWAVMGVGLVLALGLAASARLVETDREAIESGTRAFVDAIVNGDEASMDDLLASRLTLAITGSRADVDAREYILGNLDWVQEQIQRHSAGVQEAAVIANGAGRSKFVFRLLQSRSLGSGFSTWVLEWQETPGEGWQIHTVDLVAINGNPPPFSAFPRYR